VNFNELLQNDSVQTDCVLSSHQIMNNSKNWSVEWCCGVKT